MDDIKHYYETEHVIACGDCAQDSIFESVAPTVCPKCGGYCIKICNIHDYYDYVIEW